MVRQHQAVAVIASTFALIGSVPPTASADPAPLARAEAAIAATQNRPSTAVRPNPDEQNRTRPAAAPALAGSPVSCGDVCSGHGYGFASPQPASFLVTSGGSFNWADAGIGAGACVVLLAIGLGGTRALTMARKRQRAEQGTIATN